MESVELYTTIGELYDSVLAYYRKNGRDLQVVEALRRMQSAGMLTRTPPPVPPFDSGRDRESFQNFIRAMPVPASRLMRTTHGEFPEIEDDIFPPGKDVFSFQHMPYSGRCLHYHNYFELTYIVRGSCAFHYEGEKITLQEGNICLTSNLAWHEVAPQPDCTAVAIVARKSTFDSLFSGLLSRQDLVSLFFRKCLRDQGHPNYVLLHTGDDPALFRTMRELVYECYRTDDYANECCVSLLNLFLARALRASAANVTLHSYEGYSRQDLDFSMLLHYIQQNYRTVTLSSLASSFHFSEAYLSKLIQRNMSQSFTEVLRQLKMHHAEELLRNTEMKIGEISESVGYESVDHFTRTFRKVYGMAPREYRLLHNGQKREGNDHETQ